MKNSIQPSCRLRFPAWPVCPGNRIRVGMTQAEVEELLGGPPGNYGGFVWYVLQLGGWMSMEGYMRPPDSVERIWNDDDSRLEIYFNAEGRVTGHHERAKYQQAPDGFLKDLWPRAWYKVGL